MPSHYSPPTTIISAMLKFYPFVQDLLYGDFHKMGNPQNGWFILWKILLKWMIWGYSYFGKPPYDMDDHNPYIQF
jgi:hypothetical protein